MKVAANSDERTLTLSGSGAEDPALSSGQDRPEDATVSSLNASDVFAIPPVGGTNHDSERLLGEPVRYFGDYELLEEIARGGMGVVFKARQVNLNRIVALKMILSGQFAGQKDVQRFYTEAEAAANLDHPGIVPIFEIGEHQGLHYFSMGYIEGQSLAHKVTDGPLPPCVAAVLVKKICDAMAYAHERGVIHRDLKPANILIDQHGQPKVTDFGLAKQTEGKSELTGTGQILGTPAYMPPEQASGKVEEVGPLADIYSLGAILYCLLTGRPPFQAASPMETLLQVLGKDPVPPRQLNPSVPVDLETICLKCPRKDPHQRYDRACDLGDELQRFLNDEPIRARPISTRQRVWKWCRRNTLVASLAAAATLSLVAGTITSVGMAVIANARAEEAERERDEAERQRSIAAQNLQKARQAVDNLTSLSQEELRNIPSLQPLRKKILATALAYYEEFVSEFQGEAEVRSELGDAFFRLGLITESIDSWEAAEEYHRRALKIRQQLAVEDPENADYQSALGTSYREIGYQQNFAGELQEAGEFTNKAVQIFEQLSVRNPESKKYQFELARAYHFLGIHLFHAHAGNSEQLQWYYKARRLYESAIELDGDAADLAENRDQLASLYRHIGNAQKRSRNYDDAREALNASIHLLVAMLESSPESFHTRARIGLAWRDLGDLELRLNRRAEGQRAFEESLKFLADVVKDNPSVHLYRFWLATTYGALSQLSVDAGDLSKAIELRREEVAIRRDLADEAPDHVNFGNNRLVQSYVELAGIEAKAGNADAAREAAASSARLCNLIGSSVELTDDQFNQVAWYLVRFPESDQDALAEGLRLATSVHERAPDHPLYLRTLGVAQYRAGQWQSAVESLTNAGRTGEYSGDRGFFLSMAAWHLGEPATALDAYRKSTEWMDRRHSNDDELIRFRAEAAQLLKIEEREAQSTQ